MQGPVTDFGERPLPLCESIRDISWMMPKGGRGWLETASPPLERWL
jgi:hypothetical protein